MSKVHVGEWIWRFIAGVLFVAVAWMGWVIYQINLPQLVLASAFEAAAKAKVGDAGRAGPSVEGKVAPAAAEPAKDATPAPEAAKAAPASVPEPAKAAPAPEPVKPAPAPEKPAAPAKTPEQEITEAVQAWAKAWSSQDAEAYLSSYAADFKAPGGESRAAWEKARRQRIAAPKSISVTVDDLKIALEGEARAKAAFRQGYRSDVLEPMQTAKTLVLVRNEGRWLIQQETSGK